VLHHRGFVYLRNLRNLRTDWPPEDHVRKPPAFFPGILYTDGMNLDGDLCYQALRSKDARFDGRFFTAVLTTGVYCRPVCPARLPKRQNVRFFACAAAAEEAGFRPCRRCRPETSPGTPAWLGTSATVSRALRLISEGVLDEGSVDDLAARLGIGARHLRRLFLQHLGATPVRVAETRRAHFARKLLDETRLPISEIAFCAGFLSIRRFNEAMKSTFGQSPTELRARTAGTAGHVSGDALSLRLPFRLPFDWEGLIGFLSLRATPRVEAVDGNEYLRSAALDGVRGVIGVRRLPGKSYLQVRLDFPPSRGLILAVERIRRMFDLGADPLEVDRHLSRDPVLARRVRRRPGIRVPGAWDPFELAVRAILGQQITVAGATRLAGRLVEAFGSPLPSSCSSITHVFPGPEDLADAPIENCGITRGRASSIRALARAVREGRVVLDLANRENEATARLASIPGIGDWTAQYVAMRALGEPDAFPAGDLGIRRALSDGPRPASPRAVLQRAEAWRPWRAYAAMHLWMDVNPGSKERTR
jgi:AraC family transcriptional regulator of adaptative response / DNA-3-methyladenine glycosylase II